MDLPSITLADADVVTARCRVVVVEDDGARNAAAPLARWWWRVSKRAAVRAALDTCDAVACEDIMRRGVNVRRDV